jgi:hypothetical protein
MTDSLPRVRLIPATILLVVLVAVASAAVVLAGSTSKSTSGQGAGGRGELQHALALVDSVTTPPVYPFTVSLVNALQRKDVDTQFQPLDSPMQVPSVGSIGVYATVHSVWLRRLGPAGTVQQLEQVSAGAGAGIYGPGTVSSLLVPNGDFSSPLTSAWTVSQGSIATMTRANRVYASAPDSLRITGTGRNASVATYVSQSFDGGLPTAAGTSYDLGLVARTLHLSRPLSVELKLLYRDGTYQFFTVTPRQPGSSNTGIPAGSSSTWMPLGAHAVARKPVSRVVVFAADTGTQALRGSAWVDDIVLSASHSSTGS